jgi:hypothetical protein
MNVLMISPGYPGEIPRFTHALAAVGARVFGVGDQAREMLPDEARNAVTAHMRVPSLWDEDAVVAQVLEEARRYDVRFDRVECLWEPAMELAARLREATGCPGLDLRGTQRFRDKELMKQTLDAAGIRTPWHRRCRTADEVRGAVADCGFPVIVKPIAGAGSLDTYRVDSWEQLDGIIPMLGHVTEVSVEEFVEADEFTFDTVCAGGRILFENISFYRQRPLEEKKHEWVSPSSVCIRDLDMPEIAKGRAMGHAVIQAMGFQSGFTHMEWYRRKDGEVVFGEIAARPPGGYLSEVMNYASDIDLYRGWAEAVCYGRFGQPILRKYNAAIVCKRAIGYGRIQRVEGLDELRREFGDAIVHVDLLPVGAMRRDWKTSIMSDGCLIVRHPELQTTLRMAEAVSHRLRIYAG